MLPPPDVNDVSLDQAFELLCPAAQLQRLFALARDEDLNDFGDVSSALVIGDAQQASAHIVARAAGVVAGLRAVPHLLEAFNARLELDLLSADGKQIQPGEPLARLAGSARALLAVERTVLNMLSRAGGIATHTRAAVEQIVQTRCRIYDTRKTAPGHRGLDKYAVRCGGGFCHRIGLFDAVLIKDNHLANVPTNELTDFLNSRLRDARDRAPLRFIEVEVDDLDQFKAVLACEPGLIDTVLLDNFDVGALTQAVALRNEHDSSIQLEASGGITLASLSRFAQTGVDHIAIGSLTHTVHAHNLALDFEHAD